MDKILILGATGRTGKLLLEEVLNKGYSVSVLVRQPTKVTRREGLTIHQGTPVDIETLSKALEGCSFVLSALNISRRSDFPWAGLRTPKDFISQVTKNIVALSNGKNIKHYIGISAWGVSETRKDIPFWFEWTIRFSNIKYAYVEHQNQEQILADSNLNWTILRPSGLTNFTNMKNLIISSDNKPKPKLLVSRRNLAKFMAEIIGQAGFYGQKLTVSE